MDCYRRYYAEKPAIKLSWPHTMSLSAKLPNNRRSLSRTSGNTVVDDDTVPTELQTGVINMRPTTPLQARSLLGHACAAGCGHMCWVINDRTRWELP
jgi:WD repeat-containing protein 24